MRVLIVLLSLLLAGCYKNNTTGQYQLVVDVAMRHDCRNMCLKAGYPSYGVVWLHEDDSLFTTGIECYCTNKWESKFLRVIGEDEY